MERIVDPALADMQAEHDEALRCGRSGRAVAVLICGYVAVWKAISLHAIQAGPKSLCSVASNETNTRGALIAYVAVLFVAATLGLAAAPMSHLWGHAHSLKLMLLTLLPAISTSVPIALAIGIACSAPRGRSVGRASLLVLATSGTLIAFAAIQVVPTTNQAFRVAEAEEMGLPPTVEKPILRGVDELSLSELMNESRQADVNGLSSMARRFEWTYHIRFALAAAAAVMSLLGAGICRAWRARAQRVVATTLALGLYWSILVLGQENPSLPPAVCAWGPNIVLSLVAILLLRSTASGRTRSHA